MGYFTFEVHQLNFDCNYNELIAIPDPIEM